MCVSDEQQTCNVVDTIIVFSQQPAFIIFERLIKSTDFGTVLYFLLFWKNCFGVFDVIEPMKLYNITKVLTLRLP